MSQNTLTNQTSTNSNGPESQENRSAQSDYAVVNKRTGEMVIGSGLSIDKIVSDEIGGVSQEVKTSIETDTVEGLEQLQRHLDCNLDKNHKIDDGWYGRTFDLVAFTSRPVSSKRDGTGEYRDLPKALIRTVCEASDGSMFTSSSAWFYASLMQIVSFAGMPSVKNKLMVKLTKGGQADKLVRVFEVKQVVKSVKK